MYNHITHSSFKSFLAHNSEFTFLNERLGSIVFNGLILICMMIAISKPKTIVNVRQQEQELDQITLWSAMENDVRRLTIKMLYLLQEIHATSRSTSHTSRRFLTNLFCACKTTPTEKCETFVESLKQKWTMEERIDHIDVIDRMDRTHENLVTNGSWKDTNDKNTKVVALTTELEKNGKCLLHIEGTLSKQADKAAKSANGGKGGPKKVTFNTGK